MSKLIHKNNRQNINYNHDTELVKLYKQDCQGEIHTKYAA